MINFLVRRPIAVFMTTVVFLILGIVALNDIPTSLLPDIAIPQITVQVSYPDNTARELETNVIGPLRNELLQIGNLRKIDSESRDGFATIEITFDYGVNTDFAFIETNEKIDAALNFLPKTLKRPKVIKASVSDIPILNLTVGLKNDYNNTRFLQLSEFSQTVFKKRLEQLPDIAVADVSGIIKGEIVIIPNNEKLSALNISYDQITNAIKENNFELGNLIVQNGIYQYNFKLSNPLTTKEDIKQIYLNVSSSRIIQLQDVATVQLLPEKERGTVYYNGDRVVVFSIIKQADAQVYELQEDLEILVDKLVSDYPDLKFNTNQDQTKLLKLSIDNLKSSLWIGVSLAVLIMFFFLKDFKSPIIIGLSIPISLAISMFFMHLSNISINIISLSGLILGVGMMIDNAIIVIDNITQKLKYQENLLLACIKGTNEIITPLISSFLTTCSVFLPLLFLSGITGALFYDQAIAVSIGLGSSLLVSIFIIPVLFSELYKREFKIDKYFKSRLKVNLLEGLYNKGYIYFFNRKWIIYGVAIFFSGLAFYLFNHLDYRKLPGLNQKETVLTIDWNDNITLQENQFRLTELLASLPKTCKTYSQLGEQQFILQREATKSFSEAIVYIEAESSVDIINAQRDILKSLNEKYAFAKAQFTPPKTIFEYVFGTDQTRLRAQVYSKNSLQVPNEDNLISVSKFLEDQTNTNIPINDTAIVQVLFDNLAVYDVVYEKLIIQLKTLLNENVVDNLKTAQKFVPIKLSNETIDFQEAISNTFIKNERDELIPLRNLIQVKNKAQYRSIQSNRSGEHLAYDIVNDKNPQKAIDHLIKNFRNSDFNIQFTGSWFEVNKLTKELGMVILVAIALLYLIMAAQFESLWQPVIILLEIPIDIGGALLLLWIFGGSINLMAAIGIIVMSGIIINDSILKLHTINMLRKDGLEVNEAIKLAGTRRFKPILMTSLTTILALVPFLFTDSLGSVLQRPLALTIIGGMIIGTFISLYFIPLLYAFLTKIFDR